MGDPQTQTFTNSVNDILGDPARLAELERYFLLDTEAEASFDRLTKLAALLLHTPIALVSLITDERQFFKSCFGLPEPLCSTRETPVEHSFCRHVVEKNEPFIVEDARTDPRVCSSLAVRESQVGAYLGIPLVTQAGFVLGSFCVVDVQPRQWTDEEIGIVHDLAQEVVTEIELRNEVRVRRQMEEELQAIFEALADAAVRFDANGVIRGYHGASDRTTYLPPEKFLNFNIKDIMPPDIARQFQDTIDKISAGSERESLIFTLPVKGRYKTQEARFVPMEDGQVLALVRDVSDIHQIQKQLADTNRELNTRVKELEERTRDITQLSKMAHRLQECADREQAIEIIRETTPRLFAERDGAVYLLRPDEETLERVAQWGNAAPPEECFRPEDCAALRKGELHLQDGDDPQAVCQHLRSHKSAMPYICIPLHARNQVLGVLHLRRRDGQPVTEGKQSLAETVGEQISLTISNLDLRDTLRQQAIRDPLTGLFNRRYMEESLEREISRADRNAHPLGIVMMDIDRFKAFNDTHGHLAGDVLLIELGQLLRENIRSSDIACRYGGEELTLILPDADREHVRERAETLRARVAEMTVEHNDQTLGPVTVSLGVATYPAQGKTADEVLEAADKALYRAKTEGRNRVVVSDLSEEPRA